MSPHNTSVVTETNGLNLPRWLTEDYFHEVLDKEFKNYTIKEFVARAAVQAGENYMSVMFRVNIKVEDEAGKYQTVSYLVKTVPEKKDGGFVQEMDFFPKEIEMYTKVVPKFENLFKEFEKQIRFAPKCLKVTGDPDAIVMEDLKKQHFINKDRHEGLDIKHVEAVLNKIAQFHAASACLYEREGYVDELFHEGMFNKKSRDLFKESEKNFSKIYQECMRKWPTGAKYVERFSRLQENYFNKVLQAVEIDWNSFNVIIHGDLWSNNIMFRHGETGDILETYFVDLQMSKWGSPVEDLLYFLISSCNYDIKVKEFDNFISFYYNQLVDNLKLLQYPKSVPKLEDLQSALLKRGYFGIATAIGIMSVVKMDPDSEASIDNYFNDTEEGNNFKRRVYSNPRYVREMEALLPFFDSRGLLD